MLSYIENGCCYDSNSLSSSVGKGVFDDLTQSDSGQAESPLN